MSCYHPLLATQDIEENENGKHELIFHGKYTPERASAFEDPILIPCGKCLGCRLDYSRAWADRMMFELDHTGKGVFLTLTYNNAHVPIGMLDNETELPLSYSLNKEDLQKFWKRLRKKFDDKELRYFACGEYGTNTFRPHYHAIVFGLSLADLPDRTLIGTNELGQAYYRSQKIEEAWSIYHRATKTKEAYYDPIGFVLVSEVSWETCAYVARYVMKKVDSPVRLFNEWRNSYPEFILSSRRPGIGSYYLSDHGLTFDSDLQMYRSGRKMQIPKFLLEKMALTDPEGYDKLKQKRIEFANDKTMLELYQTDLDFEQLCELKEDQQYFRARQLGRNKVR